MNTTTKGTYMFTSTTLGDVIDRHSPDLLTQLDRDVAIPIVDFARQGDVLVIPERGAPLTREPTIRIRPDGVAVVRSEFGGHTHLLVAEGDVRYAAADVRTTLTGAQSIEVGAIEVRADAVAFLLHPEHGAVGLRPGRYSVRRQREWNEVPQLVLD